MLWTILVILLVLWLIGLLSHVGGKFYPPAAGGSRGCADNQPRNWPASCLRYYRHKIRSR